MTTVTAGSELGAPRHLSAESQADFYAKLLRLQQDVLTGRHPHYNFPSPNVEQDGLAQSQPSGTSKTEFTSRLPNGVPSSRSVQPTPPSSLQISSRDAKSPTKSKDASSTFKTELSGINPVLLTKPDHLIQAENKLGRVRIERSLREGVSSKNTRSGERDTGPWYGENTFDCSQLLQAATSLVKPVSGFETVVSANDDRPSRSPPVRTDSYYSSKVDSISDTERDGRVEDGEIDDADTHLQATGDEPGAEAPIRHPRISGLGPQSPQELDTCAKQPSVGDVQRTDTLHTAVQASLNSFVASPPRDDSYSPPSADAMPYVPNTRPHFEPPVPPAFDSPDQIPRGRVGPMQPPPTGRSRESESYSPPPVIPGLSNDDTQPTMPTYNGPAPPLQWNGPPPANAVPIGNRQQVQRRRNQDKNNAPPQDKGRKQKKKEARKNAQAGKAQASNGHPAHPAPGPQDQPIAERTRKRRRESEPEDDARRMAGRYIQPEPRRAVSPEPVIKEEPVSPRPLPSNGVEAPRRLVLHDDGTADIQVDKAQRTARESYLRPSRQEQPAIRSPRYVQPEPIYVDDVEQYTPPTRRRPRDDTDLRRYASMQYAQRAPSPPEQDISPRDMRYIGTPQQQVVRQPAPRYQYVDDDAPSPSMLRARRSSPIVLDDDYSPRTMMPPQTPAKHKIVVDEYGNQYIAIPASSAKRHSSGSEYVDSPQYQSQPQPRRRVASAMPLQQPAQPNYQPRPRMRAEPEIIDLVDEDERQAMPPPLLVPQKRRAEPMYDYATQPSHPGFYAPRPISRATSVQDQDPFEAGRMYQRQIMSREASTVRRT